MQKPLIFSTSYYDYLRDRMLAASGGQLERGVIQRNTGKVGDIEDNVPFKNGERYHRIVTDVEDRECILVGGGGDDTDVIEAFDIGNTLFDWGAGRIKVAVPRFPYSTMERAVKDGEAVKAKYRARLFSAIPQAPGGNRFYFIDLHSPGLPHYLEGRQARHIYAKDLVMNAARRLAGTFVIATPALDVTATGAAPQAVLPPAGLTQLPLGWTFASTDAGRMKWVESLAKELGVMPAFAYKHRDGNQTECLGVSGPVKGMFVVIYDDMIRTGGSLIEAAAAYLAAGAVGIAVISTHGEFPGDALSRLKNSGYFQKVIVTDTLPRPYELLSAFPNFLEVESVAPLLVSKVLKLAA